jgi:general secretion pathway protein D
MIANLALAAFITATSCETTDSEKKKPTSSQLFPPPADAIAPQPESIEKEAVKLATAKNEARRALSEELNTFERRPIAGNGNPQESNTQEKQNEKQPPTILGRDAEEEIPVFFDFDAVPIRDVVSVFAETLGFNYAVDSETRGTITLKVQDPTAQDKKAKMNRGDIWKLFQAILRMSGAYCSTQKNVVRVAPLMKLPKGHTTIKNDEDPNVEVELLAPQNISSAELAAGIADFLSDGAKATVLRNGDLILLTDTATNMKKILEIVKLLDSDVRLRWKRAVLRCANVSSAQIVDELAGILPVLGFPVSLDAAAPEAGTVHLAGLDRLSVIVAAAANREAINEVKRWVALLDRADVGEQEQLYVYKVVNSRAEDLLLALSTVFNIQEGLSMTASSTSKRNASLNSSYSTASQNPGSASAGGVKSVTRQVTSGAAKSASTPTETETVFTAPVNVFADGRNNRLVIRTSPRTYAMIKALLRRLDTIPTQVLLQVLIAEVRLSENMQFGVEFSGVSDISNKSVNFGSNYAGLVPQTPRTDGEYGFKYLITSGENKYAYIRGLAGTGNFKILSSPQLAAISGTEASFVVGREIPIATRTLSEPNSTNTLTTSNEIEYKNIGIILNITPQVTEGGLITMDLSQIVSNQGENVQVGGHWYPSFINRQVETSLTMHDGETVMVSGIIQETDRSNNDSMPFVARIPLLATLLGYTTAEKQRTELLIMITPTVISKETTLQRMVERYKKSVAMIKEFNNSIKKKDEKDDAADAENTK